MKKSSKSSFFEIFLRLIFRHFDNQVDNPKSIQMQREDAWVHGDTTYGLPDGRVTGFSEWLEVITTSSEINPQSGKKWSKKFVLDSLMILFSSFFGNTCVQKDKISNLILIKKTSFMEENIIYLSTKIEFDGRKVPKTYKNEF